MHCFAAIDFETATGYRDSACEVGVVRVEGGVIVERFQELIRPPQRPWTKNSRIHGLWWRDLQNAAPFAGVHRLFAPLLDGVDFIAAHNACFDRSVLRTCCALAGVCPPSAPFLCTRMLARRTWKLKQTRLVDVADTFDIPLHRHHRALSDAEACAAIVMRAIEVDANLSLSFLDRKKRPKKAKRSKPRGPARAATALRSEPPRNQRPEHGEERSKEELTLPLPRLMNTAALRLPHDVGDDSITEIILVPHHATRIAEYLRRASLSLLFGWLPFLRRLRVKRAAHAPPR